MKFFKYYSKFSQSNLKKYEFKTTKKKQKIHCHSSSAILTLIEIAIFILEDEISNFASFVLVKTTIFNESTSY